MIEQVAREILVKTKRKVFSPNLGNNQTAFIGNGMDFSELREYYFGDDVRKINWKATAKSGTPYINLFTEERELNVIVAMAMGGSVTFGSKRIKQETMTEILALLGYSIMKNSDNFTPLLFSDHEEFTTKATKNIASLNEIVPQALGLDLFHKKADYQALCDYLLGRIKQRSILFLVGDFFEEVDLTMLAAKHELYCIVVRDRLEENPPAFGEIDLLDPDTMQANSLEVDSSMANKVKEAVKEHDKRLYAHFNAQGIAHTKIYTDEDPFIKLNQLVR